jgi:hypothetical protein
MPPFPFKRKNNLKIKTIEKIKPMPPSTLQVNYSPFQRIK